MAKQEIHTLDLRSLQFLRREIRRQVQAALHQLAPQAARTWRPGGGEEGNSLRRFELKTNLEPGGYAEAYDLVWDKDKSSWEPDLEGKTKTVYDSTGIFRGRKRITPDTEADDTIRGFRGTCVKHSDTGEWEIVYLEEGITMFSAMIKAPRKVAAEDAYIEIKSPDDDADDGAAEAANEAAKNVKNTENTEATTDEVNSDSSEEESPNTIWQSTDKAPWHTKDGKAPTKIRNPLGLSGNDGEHEGMIKLWWKAINDLPEGWKWMDGSDNTKGSKISMISPFEKFARGWQENGVCTDEDLGDETHVHVIDSNVTNIYADYSSGSDEIFTTFSSGDQVVHDPGHTHSESEEEHLPPYNHLHFIEYEGGQRTALVVWNDEWEEYCVIKIGPGIYWQMSDSVKAEIDAEDAEEDAALEEEEE